MQVPNSKAQIAFCFPNHIESLFPGGEGGDEEEAGPSADAEEEKQKLLADQDRLAERGVAEMALMYLSASNGEPSETVWATLKLGISILRGGNTGVQKRMAEYLKDKRDVGFFTSISRLMYSCDVLNLDAFERIVKAEGLGKDNKSSHRYNNGPHKYLFFIDRCQQ